MGLSSRQGSLSTTSLPNKHNYVVDNISTSPSPEQRLIDQNFVKDVGINKTAINLDRETGMLSAINKFIGGSEIIVSYFHHQYSRVLDQSNDSDLSNVKNQAHTDLLLINDFRFKLSDPLNYTFENGNVTSDVLGTGITYAGFNPVLADFFLYELEPGLLGKFKLITTPTRMSIKSGTCHEIQFRLESIVTNEDIIALKQTVIDERWFDTQNKLNENISLLLGSDVALISTCNNKINTLIEYYNRHFTNTELETYTRPDGIYDPYLVDFIYKIFPIRNPGVYADKILVKPKNRHYSIWSKILSPTSIDHLDIKNRYKVINLNIATYSIFINALANRDYIELTDNLDETTSKFVFEYPPFGDISGITVNEYTEFQKIVSTYVNNEIISPARLLVAISNFKRLDEVNQFYQIPVLVYLLKIVINNVRYNSNKNVDNIDIYLPNRLVFNPHNITVTHKLSLSNTIDFEVLSVTDELGNNYRLTNSVIERFQDKVVVDLSDVMKIKGISSITGTWSITVTHPTIKII